MTDYKAIVEDRSCSSGCNTSKWCMCALADDMADEIERLREALREISTRNFPEGTATLELRKIARAALGENE